MTFFSRAPHNMQNTKWHNGTMAHYSDELSVQIIFLNFSRILYNFPTFICIRQKKVVHLYCN